MMQHPDHSRSFYDVLGVAPTASAARIRVAFLKLAQEWHPDLNQNDQDAEWRFKQIRQVYEVLSDPLKRAAYDEDPGRFRLTEGGIAGTDSSPICPYPVEPTDWRTTASSASPRRARPFTPPPISTRSWRPESWLVFCGGIVTILVLTAIPILLMRAHQRQQQFLQARASYGRVTASANLSPADAVSARAPAPPTQERRHAPLDSVLASVASLREQQAPDTEDPSLTTPAEPTAPVRSPKASSHGPLGAGSTEHWPTSELIRSTPSLPFTRPLGKFMGSGPLPPSGAAPAAPVAIAPDPFPAVVLPADEREATSIPSDLGASTLRLNDGSPWLLTTSTHESSTTVSAAPVRTAPLRPLPPATLELPVQASYLGWHEPVDLATLAGRHEEPYHRPLSPLSNSSGPLSAASVTAAPAMIAAAPLMVAPPSVLAPPAAAKASPFTWASGLGTVGTAPPVPSGILPENARLAGLVTDVDDPALIHGARSTAGVEPPAFIPMPGTMFATGYSSTVQNMSPSSGLPLGESAVTRTGLGMMQLPGPAAIDLRPVPTLGAVAPPIGPLPLRRFP